MTTYRAPTAAEKTDIAKIDKDLAAVIAIYGLHPKVQSSMAGQGYISTDMVSELYPTGGALHQHAADEFDFPENAIATAADTPNGIAEEKFTARTSKAERVKLALIWHQCLTLRATKATILTGSPSPPP